MLKDKIKMIVTDLDNTLLRTDKTISDYTAHILNKCKEKNIKIAFATARPKRTVNEFFEKHFADCLAIHNGAVIYAGDKEISHFGISPDITKNILVSLAHRFPKTTWSVEIDDVLYANFDLDEGWEYIYSDFTDLPNKPAEKILTVLSPDMSKETLGKYLPDNLYIEISDGNFAMIMNRKAGKHNAVKILADYYNYDLSEVAAFGDDYNDVEMLRECGIGVAVANAIDEAKAAADFICASNDNDGIAKWIEQNIL